jgi:hypothetical protein
MKTKKLPSFSYDNIWSATLQNVDMLFWTVQRLNKYCFIKKISDTTVHRLFGVKDLKMSQHQVLWNSNNI